MKKKIIIYIMLLMCGNIAAQQDLLMTQQWFSRINKNPASTGNSNNLDIFMLSRFQFAGFGSGPQSNLINVHNYFEGIRSGVGLTFYYDNPGGIGNSNVNVKVAYAGHFNLKEDLLLSLGVSGGILNKSFDPDKHVLRDEGERGMETFPSEKVSELKPDFDFGFELSMPKLLLGASITHLGRTRDNLTTLTVAQQFYGYARGNFSLGENFDLAPSVVYTQTGKVSLITLGGMLFYKKMAWIGLDYRPPSPDVIFKDFDYSMLVAMIGFEKSAFRIGYSYDLSLGRLNDLAYSTHELMLSFKIRKEKKSTVRFIQ